MELWAVLSGPMVAGGVAGLVGCGCVTVDDEAWTFNRRSMGWWFAFGEWGLA